MTPDAQRIAIAEACGYEWCRVGVVAKPYRMLCIMNPLYDKADMTEPICNPQYMWDHGAIPDYLNDLNAMHEAEKVLDVAPHDKNQIRYIYSSTLYSLVPQRQQPLRATAAQRAEAFLRALGKWSDA